MKDDYSIKLVSKQDSASILLKYHYLKDISKGFKSGINVGLFKHDRLVGVCIFTGFPVPELSKGMLGLSRDDQEGLFELSRLCLIPEEQAAEHNLASWFVSRAIKFLKQIKPVRVILSYADSEFHGGTVYKACNFKYYGLSSPKKDFWILQPDGSYKKHSRGSVKNLQGEWRDRSRKHRYVIVVDKKVKVLWKEFDKSECLS
jgi:hypothetical protein